MSLPITLAEPDMCHHIHYLALELVQGDSLQVEQQDWTVLENNVDFAPFRFICPDGRNYDVVLGYHFRNRLPVEGLSCTHLSSIKFHIILIKTKACFTLSPIVLFDVYWI